MKTIDITPLGMQSAEGEARVRQALERWQAAQADVANRAHDLLRAHADEIAGWLEREGYEEAAEDVRDLAHRASEMIARQDAFLLAVAGRTA